MTALDPKTCEAITAELSTHLDHPPQRTDSIMGSSAEWAISVIRKMMKQPPEPAATPTAGAMRAASAFLEMWLTYKLEMKSCEQIAAIIDEQTALPALVAACKALDAIEDIGDVNAARQLARAAIAKYDGVPDKGGAPCGSNESG